MTTTLDIPELALVALVGISGSGKSTFARKHFLPSQVLSSDVFRAMVADDENDQSASSDAFDVLHYVAGKRLRAGRLTVVDATNVQQFARAGLVKVAREHDVLPVAIVIDAPEPLCWERTQVRPDRDFGRAVLRRQHNDLRRSLNSLQREGFRKVHVVRDPSDVEIRYEKLFNDRKELTGPFDIIGDVHGCHAELVALLRKLGWDIDTLSHPDGRTAVFVGDLVDRGPDSPGVLRLVMSMVAAGTALCVSGNHEAKLLRHLNGRKVQVTHGLAETIEQLSANPVPDLKPFLDGLISHYVLDGGRLVVAHAGLKEEYHGRASGRVRAFAMYGDTTGETDEYGLPVRYPWARDYRGKAIVVYGHTPTPVPEWVNNTICLDTGAVFGGRLTALRYPEKELVYVEALAEHYKPLRPLTSATSGPEAVSLADVTGRRHLSTDFGTVTIPAEHSAAALEVMSRFAVDPRSLLWLPPTMAPCSTSSLQGYLEHPAEALNDYRAAGVQRVVCQEKHMGSRAVTLVRKDGGGVIYTRTGRSFFGPERTATLLASVRAAVAKAGLWEELGADWLLFDSELLPWSSKARELILGFAAVGAAGGAALPAALDVLDAAARRGLDVSCLKGRLESSLADVHAYTKAYSHYVAPDDAPVTLAPFAMLAASGSPLTASGSPSDDCQAVALSAGHERATAGQTPGGGARHFADRDHGWHLSIADRLVEADPALFTPTRRLVLDLGSPSAPEDATAWWLGLTSSGGEGMVVKPYEGLLARDAKGRLIQPGIKCRGQEYLRIIYGPSYLEPSRLAALRDRRLGRKRAMALREHGLGLSALSNVANEGPFYRTHQLVFAILASESEPVDPRL